MPLNDDYADPSMARAFAEHAADSPYNAHYDRPAVLSLLGEVRGLRVLDACCGPGLYAEALLDGGASVAAFDASEAMLALARERVGERVALRTAVLGGPLPYDDATFDRAVCALAIHYADDRRAAFAELHRVLRPAGALVLSVQHPTDDWLRHGGSYFDSVFVVDTWRLDGRGTWQIGFWREPLSALTEAATGAGFLIERLVETRPTEELRRRWPDTAARLDARPAFLVLRLLKRS